MSEVTTLAEARAAKRRAKATADAEASWRKAVKSMGLNAVALRSGLRAIRESQRPGSAVNSLVAEYRKRAGTAATAPKRRAAAPAAPEPLTPADDLPMHAVAPGGSYSSRHDLAPKGAEVVALSKLIRAAAPAAPVQLDRADPSDVLELAVRLRRKRGQGWYGSDPLGKALGRLDRDVAEGIVTRAEFERRAQQIATLPAPPKIAPQPVKLTPALEKIANAKGAEAALRAAGELKAGDLPDHLKNVKRTP